MADHVMKKYFAKVEKTVYVLEEVEILAETERQAEELLDDYCAREHDERIKVIHVEEQEEIEGLDLRSHGEKGYHAD